MHAAGSAGVISARLGSDSSEFAHIYYMGMKPHTTPPEWKLWKLRTCIGTDVLTIIATIITLYQACTLPRDDPRWHFGLSLWVFPLLPVALIGLSLLVAERFVPQTHDGNRMIMFFIVGLLAAVELAVCLVWWKFNTADGHGTWWISFLFYFVMILPFFESPYFHMLSCMFGWFARTGGVSIAALAHYAGGEPYCEIHGKGFAAVNITMGGIAALLAFTGAHYHHTKSF
jgi:hypothetical protein